MSHPGASSASYKSTSFKTVSRDRAWTLVAITGGDPPHARLHYPQVAPPLMRVWRGASPIGVTAARTVNST